MQIMLMHTVYIYILIQTVLHNNVLMCFNYSDLSRIIQYIEVN